MTLPTIRYTFELPELNTELYIKIIVAACPWTKLESERNAVYYNRYGWLPMDNKVRPFLLETYSYDAIDVSHIIKEFKHVGCKSKYPKELQ